MVISIFNMLQLIHTYKLETASGPNVAHVAAPAQNELEIKDKEVRKNIRRAKEEVTQVKSSKDEEYAKSLEKILNEYLTKITYLASVNDKGNVGQLFWTARKLYVLRQLYDNGQLEIRLKGFDISPKVQKIIERMDLLVEKDASMPDADSSPNSVSKADSEAGNMHQAQTKMIYELTRPIYARMDELRQQEIESNTDLGRMRMLYSEYEACCGEPSHYNTRALH